MSNQLDAFPNKKVSYNRITGEPTFSSYDSGMSLRDYFAAKALIGIIANGSAGDWDEAAKYAYLAADAMLIARGTTS